MSVSYSLSFPHFYFNLSNQKFVITARKLAPTHNLPEQKHNIFEISDQRILIKIKKAHNYKIPFWAQSFPHQILEIVPTLSCPITPLTPISQPNPNSPEGYDKRHQIFKLENHLLVISADKIPLSNPNHDWLKYFRN